MVWFATVCGDVRIYVTASETGGDRIVAAGGTTFRVWSVERGWLAQDITSVKTSDGAHYTDTDHDPDYFRPDDVASFVAGYRIVGCPGAWGPVIFLR